jgi:hypothetical protein
LIYIFINLAVFAIILLSTTNSSFLGYLINWNHDFNWLNTPKMKNLLSIKELSQKLLGLWKCKSNYKKYKH